VGHVIIFLPILLQEVQGLHTQKMVAIGFAVFGTWEQTDGQTVNYSRIQFPFDDSNAVFGLPFDFNF